MVGGQVEDLARRLESKNQGVTSEKAWSNHFAQDRRADRGQPEAGAIPPEGGAAQRRPPRRFWPLNRGWLFRSADELSNVVGDKREVGKNGSAPENDKLTYARLTAGQISRDGDGHDGSSDNGIKISAREESATDAPSPNTYQRGTNDESKTSLLEKRRTRRFSA